MELNRARWILHQCRRAEMLAAATGRELPPDVLATKAEAQAVVDRSGPQTPAQVMHDNLPNPVRFSTLGT